MGFLAYPVVNESDNYQGDKKEKKFYMSANYTNRNALKFVIEDVTRSRPNEKYYSDLVAYGARGACYGLQAKDITACLECVANAYNIELRGGRRVYHEIFWLSDSDMEGLCYDIRRLWDFTWECSTYYFAQGHQVVFAIHSDGKKYHIVFLLTRALAVDKSNKAGDVYGKMLVLTFEDNEDDMINRILSLINTKEEVIQMSGMNEHLLNFKGLMIDEVQA